MKRLSAFLASLLLTAASFAGVTYTSGGWQLVNTTGTTDQPSYAACVTALKAQPLPARQRTDYCREKWLTKVTVDPVPTPPPVVVPPAATCDPAAKPADELQAMACPNTDTKWWNQTRTYTCVGTTWTATPWAPTAPGANYCIVDPPASGEVMASPPTADVSKLLPGQTLVLRAGVYTSLKLAVCKPDAWCTVRAENDGTVTVPDFNIGAGNWYVSLEGLNTAGSGSVVTGNFVKLKRMSFKGGPATGNSVSLQIGTNDRTPGADHILLEDSWVYGAGGRYKVLVYNSTNVVLRRVVVRHDGGWKYDGQNPQGGIALYDSAHVRAQDVACVDAVQGLSGFEACIYLVSNGTTSTKASDVVVNGAIVIDSPNNGIAAEGQASASWVVNDAAVLRSAAGGFNTNGQGHLVVTRAFADVKGAPFAAWNGSLSASACIYKGGSNSGASLSNCSSTLPAAITSPNATGQGPQLVNRIGVDGTLFGDPGFEDVTTVPLFPWPNEARMKADFDLVRAAFGGRSFTGYVQGATP